MRIASCLLAAALAFSFARPASGAGECVQYSGGTFPKCTNGLFITNLNGTAISTGLVGTGVGGTGLTTFGGAGALLYSTSASALAALPAGTTGYLLQSGGTGAPSWLQTLGVANGGLGLTSTVAGGIPYGTGTTSYGTLPAGLNGQLLQSGGAGAPSWVSTSGLSAGTTVISGQTLWATPAAGEVGYITTTNKTFAKALATGGTTADAICIYQSVAGSCVLSGATTCLLDAGLTVASGDTLFLSTATAGRFTNVAPSTSGQYIVRLAKLIDATGYNSGTGSAQSCAFSPKEIVGPL